jgi:hypothetical protein
LPLKLFLLCLVLASLSLPIVHINDVADRLLYPANLKSSSVTVPVVAAVLTMLSELSLFTLSLPVP